MVCLTSSFCVRPSSIFLSHTGRAPVSVANEISKPASLNAVNGIAVSKGR